MFDFNLKNKVAVVTGSTRGIGLAIADLLAESGAHVYLNGLDKIMVADCVDARKKNTLAVDGIAGDISDETFVKLFIQTVYAKESRIDILVNNAGISEFKFVEDIEAKAWDTLLGTNLKSVFLMCREAAPLMKKQKFGKIVNISSVAGLIGRLGGAHYSASKGGIIGLTKTLAKELGPFNIQINVVAPSVTDTDLSRKISGNNQKFFDKVARETPLKRVAKPEDIAGAVLFFSSSLSDFVTGQVLVVDGGAGLVHFGL